MAHREFNGVQQFATGSGTGALTLGAATDPQFTTLTAAGITGDDTVYLRIQHESNHNEWEVVLGLYSGGTITRIMDENSSSATGSLISFSSGNKIISGVSVKGKNEWNVDNLAGLKALRARPSVVNVLNGAQTGVWDWYLADSTTADDYFVVTCTSGPSGRYKKRISVGAVNVIEAGADNTGVADSLAAFNRAVSKGSGAIKVPKGSYILSTALSITSFSQVSIEGEARGSTILKFTTGGISISIPSGLTTDIYSSPTIRDLTIMTDAAGTSVGLKILASVPVNMHPTIENLEFIGSDGAFGPSQTVTGTSHTSTTIDGISSTAGIVVNSTCEGSGVPRSTYVTAVGANSVTLNQATTSSVTASFFFNAGPVKYWNYGIELEGVWFPSISNIRISGGGAGRTTAGIYIHGGIDAPMFDYFLSHMEISGCTTSLLITGQIEGLMLSQFDFYTTRDGIIATNPGTLSVGTWQISDGTIYCSRNPISIDHFSSLQLNNISPVRGVGENAWNPAAGGVSYDGPNGGFVYAGSNISISGPGNLVQLSNINIYNPSLLTVNAIYLEDVEVFTINGVNLLTGIFTNGLNFAGTTSKGSYDNIVSYGTITNPLVFGASTGFIKQGSFINENTDVYHTTDARDVFTANDTTPSVKPVKGKNIFYTANSTSTTITKFDDAVVGQRFSVQANDVNTTIQHNANILLRNGVSYLLSNATIIHFLQEGTTYCREIGRSTPIDDRLDIAGSGTIAVNLDVGSAITVGADGVIRWATRTQIFSPIDGYLTVLNEAAGVFTQIQWGGGSSSFPSMVFSGIETKFRLADNSADSPISAAAITASGTITVTIPGADTVIGGAAASGSYRVRYEAHVPSVVAWRWGADTDGYWKLAANSTTFADPSITVNPANNVIKFDSTAQIDGAAGTYRTIEFFTSGSKRWSAQADNTAESGGNAGTNFSIFAFDDSGGFLYTVFFIDRATATVAIPGVLAAQGYLQRNNPVTKTGNFSLAGNENWLINNKSGSSCTVTLPAANTCGGREVHFVNWQAQTVVSASSNVRPRNGGSAGTAILPATAGSWCILVADSVSNTWIETMGGV